jgi:hypothetical protein
VTGEGRGEVYCDRRLGRGGEGCTVIGDWKGRGGVGCTAGKGREGVYCNR